MSMKNELLALLAEYDNSQITEAVFIDKVIEALDNNYEKRLEQEIKLEFVKSRIAKYEYDVEADKMYKDSPITNIGIEAVKFSEIVMKGMNVRKK